MATERKSLPSPLHRQDCLLLRALHRKGRRPEATREARIRCIGASKVMALSPRVDQLLRYLVQLLLPRIPFQAFCNLQVSKRRSPEGH